MYSDSICNGFCQAAETLAPVAYYSGIIDYLQEYNGRKKVNGFITMELIVVVEYIVG